MEHICENLLAEKDQEWSTLIQDITQPSHYIWEKWNALERALKVQFRKGAQENKNSCHREKRESLVTHTTVKRKWCGSPCVKTQREEYINLKNLGPAGHKHLSEHLNTETVVQNQAASAGWTLQKQLTNTTPQTNNFLYEEGARRVEWKNYVDVARVGTVSRLSCGQTIYHWLYNTNS